MNNDFLHIHLPIPDEGIEEIEKVLGVKFTPVFPETIPTEKVDVCPMELPKND